ncbi:hypothetical protein [Rivularia sp. UHCC 0363]|uniref:hypothetical protein n=1 Tax=Rivularia sp. UHCC 0363 TaxID=3110244 RepID=UPI002B1FC4C0|nr:hypothetical protein [Rivularia sp. UHCC 0363]MEA5595443.1 hypothetical protein [Rivularia sp. UHCC 0363]
MKIVTNHSVFTLTDFYILTMNQEKQEPKKTNTQEQDNSRSPGVDRGLSSTDTSKKNTKESNQD